MLSYWGIDAAEGALMQELNTSATKGTSPDAIVSMAQARGLSARLATNLTIADLRQSVADKVPVIVLYQAQRPNASTPWQDEWENGQYVVVIGADDTTVSFEDPATLGTRGAVPSDEFLARWHGYYGPAPLGPDAKVFAQPGIFITGSGATANSSTAKP